MKGEVGADGFLFGCIRSVAEAMDWSFGMGLAPVDDILGESMEDEVDEKIISICGRKFEKLAPQDRRANGGAGKIFGGVKGEGQMMRAMAGHGNVLADAELLKRKFFCAEIVRVFLHELMADGKDGDGMAVEEVVDAHHRFEKIYDQIGPGFLDGRFNNFQTSSKSRGLFDGVNGGCRQGDAAVLLLDEARAHDASDGDVEGLFKEAGQIPGCPACQD